MNLDHTHRLLTRELEGADPLELLVNVLESAIELLSIEGNNFDWSSWIDAAQALDEVQSLLDRVRTGALPAQSAVAILFAQTGPMQEVSLSSGWSEIFLQVAERYDHVEQRIWR